MTRKRAVLDQLNIVVRDMDAAVDFYRRLGLEIPDTLPLRRSGNRGEEDSRRPCPGSSRESPWWRSRSR